MQLSVYVTYALFYMFVYEQKHWIISVEQFVLPKGCVVYLLLVTDRTTRKKERV